MTAASQLLKTAVSKVEKDIKEGKTMRSRHGILLEAVRETKWKMIMLEDKLKWGDFGESSEYFVMMSMC